MKHKKRNFAFWTAIMLALLLWGCKKDKVELQKVSDLEYTVTSEERLPAELKSLVDKKKKNPFKMTYRDGEYLYICQGYGEQPKGGYSIQVEDVYFTGNAIYFKSMLIGPLRSEPQTFAPTYPYIAVKIEYRDMTVVFD